MKNISVIGLGSMGYGIAQSLIRSGYKVYGKDKNPIQQKKIGNSNGNIAGGDRLQLLGFCYII